MSAADEMPIKALAPWFGSKRNLAPEIVRELGSHSAYWEPFCGSMAVLLAKSKSGHETLNDLHGDLTNFARCIANPRLRVRLWRRLRWTVMSDGIFADARAYLDAHPLREGLDDNRAYWWFCESWMQRNGTAGTDRRASFAIRWTPFGGAGGQRFQSAVRSLRAWGERLSNALIITGCAFVMLERVDDVMASVVYVDSPYIDEGGAYSHNFDKPCPICERVHTHEELSGFLQRFVRARVVVSYYDHPSLAALYAPNRWIRRNIDVSKAMAHQGKRGENDVRATEVLLINGPSYANEEAGLFEAVENHAGAKR